MCIPYRGNALTEPFPSNYDYSYAERFEGYTKYVVVLCSGTTTCIPGVANIGSGIQKLMGGCTDTVTVHHN
jgi:hypothetical protein